MASHEINSGAAWEQRLPAWLRRFAGYDVSDDLLRDLVGSIFASARTIILGNTIGAAIVFATWAIEGDRFFGVCAFTCLCFGVLRIRTLLAYRKISHLNDGRRETIAWDLRFFMEACAFSATVGINTLLIMLTSDSETARILAFGTAIGFASSFVARNAARPLLVLCQVSCAILPAAVGFLIDNRADSGWIALFIAGYICINAFIAGNQFRHLCNTFQASRRIEFLAHYDPLTGLANRLTMTQEIAAAIGRGAEFAVCYVDLDRFKEVNDTLGHARGDEMLKTAAARLKGALGPGDFVARFGGDEFVVLLDNCNAVRAEATSLKLCLALSQAYLIDGNKLENSASLGISLYPQDSRTADNLLKNADLALYKAKAAGRGTLRFYTREMETALSDRLEMERDMRAAIAGEHFALVYQPIVDLRTGETASCEALIRWPHPARGTIPPGAFIPLAEQTGMICEIGEWALMRACLDAASWKSQAKVAVNLSVVQFRDPERLVAAVDRALEASKLDPARLELEITESLLLENGERTMEALAWLKALGAHISLDDFGVGYSSLSYLSQFPFSKVKIDMVFTRSVTSDKASRSIISAVCGIARDLSMKVVVEGIETPAQQNAIIALGAQYGQGFLLGRPQMQADILKLFEARLAA